MSETVNKLGKEAGTLSGWFWFKGITGKKISVKLLVPLLALVMIPEAFLRLHKPHPVTPSNLAKEGLGVKELITNVKAELTQIERDERSRGEAALFEVKDFDLEINFLVHTHTTDKGEVMSHLVTVGEETQTALDRVQKIKLHLTTLPPRQIKGKADLTLSSSDSNIIGRPPPPITAAARKRATTQ